MQIGTKVFDTVSKSYATVIRQSAFERCVVVKHSDGTDQIVFKSLLKIV